MVTIGSRVFVRNDQFEGFGVVEYVAHHGELFPVQMKMERPDENGHKIKRVAFKEIQAEHKVYVVNDPKPLIQSLINNPPRQVAIVNRYRNGYKVGDKYIVGPSQDEKYFNVYLFDKPNQGPIGSYMNDFLEIIGPYEEEKTAIPLKATKQAEIEAIEPEGIFVSTIEEKPDVGQVVEQIKVDKKTKAKEDAGQLNMFEFMEGLG